MRTQNFFCIISLMAVGILSSLAAGSPSAHADTETLSEHWEGVTPDGSQKCELLHRVLDGIAPELFVGTTEITERVQAMDYEAFQDLFHGQDRLRWSNAHRSPGTRFVDAHALGSSRRGIRVVVLNSRQAGIRSRISVTLSGSNMTLQVHHMQRDTNAGGSGQWQLVRQAACTGMQRVR